MQFPTKSTAKESPRENERWVILCTFMIVIQELGEPPTMLKTIFITFFFNRKVLNQKKGSYVLHIGVTTVPTEQTLKWFCQLHLCLF